MEIRSAVADMLSPARCCAPGCRAVIDAAGKIPFGWRFERGPSSNWLHLCPLDSAAWEKPEHRPVTGYQPADRGCACGFRAPLTPDSTNGSMDRAYAEHLVPYLGPHPDLERGELAAALAAERQYPTDG